MFNWLRLLGIGISRSTDDLVRLVDAGGDASPALRVIADEWLARLHGAVGEKNINRLLLALPVELDNIKRLKLDPRDHPSDL